MEEIEMGWSTRNGAGSDERRNEKALHRQHDRNSAALKAGDPKATRINERMQDRVRDARREGR